MLVLASLDPIANCGPDQLAMVMPSAASDDLLEWSFSAHLPAYLGQVLLKEFSIEQALAPDPRIRVTDDHPYNEYFLLRRWGLL
jgi:spermidine synthase